MNKLHILLPSSVSGQGALLLPAELLRGFLRIQVHCLSLCVAKLAASRKEI